MDDNEWLAAHLADGFSRAFLVDARAAGLPRDGQPPPDLCAAQAL